MRPCFVLIAVLAALPLLAVPRSAAAQSGFHPRWEIPGFDFRKDGGWRVRARRVAELRHQLIVQRRQEALNAVSLIGSAPSSTQVTGTVLVPALFFSYRNTLPQFKRDTSQYASALFGPNPPPNGNPYTLRTFYEQMSNGVFSLRGKMIGWVVLDSNEVTYTGKPGTCPTKAGGGNPLDTKNCNGLFSASATNRMQNGLRQALARVDASINFSQFDNDGPDLIPNSGDDDGYVDMIMFAHPTKDGACGGFPGGSDAANNHIWSHRFVLVDALSIGYRDYVTNDPSNKPAFGNTRISDYFVTSALGGASACDTTQIMPIGTAAHEFGHALGLPDLYDTEGPTEGIGEWGLMGSGNFTSPLSPSRMEAWSLNELGWVSLRILGTTGTYHVGAAPVSDTAFYVRARGAKVVGTRGDNPRGEYFLIENRQSSQADTALIRIHCQRSGLPSTCPGGMLIWHADSMQIAGSGFHSGNRVNVGSIHGLAVEEADGLRQLWCGGGGCNRGDAGDYYPGKSGNTAFSVNTNPAAITNLDGSFAGFAIDSIRQVVPGGQMAFRLRFGYLTIVRASDTNSVVSVDGSTFNVYRNLLDNGSTHTVSIADTQPSADNRTQWRFAAWTDGGLRTHAITGSLSGDTLIATFNRDFKLIATAGPGGTIASNPLVNLAGSFVAEGNPVQLTATPDSGRIFGCWSGDTASSDVVVTLPMDRPYTVAAAFATTLAINAAATRPNGVMGAAYADTLRVTGGSGANDWSVTAGALPQGVTLDAPTGVLSGFPRRSGAFAYTATDVSCTQTQSQAFTFSVTTPVVATADVIAQILGPTAPLNADQARYLDYLGNNNGSFDVGDFLAWVKTTGAALGSKGARP